jgi:hypothetical protein
VPEAVVEEEHGQREGDVAAQEEDLDVRRRHSRVHDISATQNNRK